MKFKLATLFLLAVFSSIIRSGQSVEEEKINIDHFLDAYDKRREVLEELSSPASLLTPTVRSFKARMQVIFELLEKADCGLESGFLLIRMGLLIEKSRARGGQLKNRELLLIKEMFDQLSNKQMYEGYATVCALLMRQCWDMQLDNMGQRDELKIDLRDLFNFFENAEDKYRSTVVKLSARFFRLLAFIYEEMMEMKKKDQSSDVALPHGFAQIIEKKAERLKRELEELKTEGMIEQKIEAFINKGSLLAKKVQDIEVKEIGLEERWEKIALLFFFAKFCKGDTKNYTLFTSLLHDEHKKIKRFFLDTEYEKENLSVLEKDFSELIAYSYSLATTHFAQKEQGQVKSVLEKILHKNHALEREIKNSWWQNSQLAFIQTCLLHLS